MSVSPLSKPLIRAPMTMTTITPIATPRMVSAARALWARSDARAMPALSSMGVMLLLPQRDDGVEPRRPAGGIDAGQHADAAAQHDAEQDRERRDGGGERRRDVEQNREHDARG